MRILLTGSKGQLGRCFKDRLPEEWELIAADSATLDITDAEAVLNMVKNFQPDAIVNAAAYTAVDLAESQRAKAFAVNAAAVASLAAAARAVHAKFIHISTDYVFDGSSKVPYTETAPPAPQSAYGQSKLAGELLALAANPDSVIVRSAWIFSEYGRNFVKTMLEAAAERDELYVVQDQTGCPTYAGDLAQLLVNMLEKATFPRGIFHYCGNTSTSWHGFAEAVFHTAATLNPAFKTPHLHPIDTSGYPTPAPRPAYSVLDCHKACQELGAAPSDWQKALGSVVRKLNDAQA